LANPEAEAAPGSLTGDLVPIPGWTRSGAVTVVPYGAAGDYLQTTSPRSLDPGTRFFAGQGTLTQELDLRNVASTINTGTVVASLGAWLGGAGASDDSPDVSVVLLDAIDTPLATYTLPGVSAAERANVTRLNPRQQSFAVPPEARLARVTVTFTNNTGGAATAFADNFNLTFTGATGLLRAPVNRWSFFRPAGPIPDGTVLYDSVGGANAVLRGAGATADVPYGVGRGVRLPGGSSGTAAYVDLPNGIISSKTRVTLECWFTQFSGGGYKRLFDFGNGTAGEITGPGGTATGVINLIGYAEQGIQWQDPAILPDGYFQALTGSGVPLGRSSHTALHL
jgi:hypothetical protein